MKKPIIAKLKEENKFFMKKLAGLLIFTVLIFINLSTFVLAETKKKVWLGIIIAKSEQKEFSTSIMVKEVEAGSPAEKAGIKKGDLINSINKKKTKNPIHFIRAMNVLSSGDKVEIELIRDKKYIAKTVTLSSKTFDLGKAEKRMAKPYSLGFFGISTRDKKEIRINYYPKKITDKYLFAGSKDETLIVTCLKKGSRAEKAGIKLYDEIINIDGKDIKNTPSLNFSEKREIKVKLLRGGKTIEVKVVPELWENLGKLPYICVGEYKEYECSSVIKIAIDRRPDDYWERIFSCLEEKNVPTIPFGPIQHELDWIKVKALSKTIQKYAYKENRSTEKLYHYMPKGVKILDEIDDYLKKTKQVQAPYEYKQLRKHMVYGYKYAQVPGLKNLAKLEISEEVIKNYKTSILKVLERKELSVGDQRLFTESFNPLRNYKENAFIKSNWEKAIDLIDWKWEGSLYSYRIFYHLSTVYSDEGNYLRAFEILEDGRKKLKEWKKVNPNKKERMYVTRKKMLVEYSALARIFSIRVESDLNKLKDVAEDIEKEIDYFYSLPTKLQKDVLKASRSHLTSLNRVLVITSIFFQDHQKANTIAHKNLELTKKIYDINNIEDKEYYLGAYYQLVMSYMLAGNSRELIFYFNQWKNVAVEIVNTPEGAHAIGTQASFFAPILINLGLFNETEELVTFVNKNINFGSSHFDKMQKSFFDYAAGKISMMKKDYKKAVKYLEASSKLFLDNPNSDIATAVSAQATMTLLEAYYLKGDMKNYNKHFSLLTGYKPDNYYFASEFSPQKNFFIPKGQILATAYTVFDYNINKGNKISIRDEKEIKALSKNIFKDFVPGEESKIDILTNYVKLSSLLPSGDKMLSKIIPEIKKEYSNSIFSSNLAPSFRADDIIQGYLNASHQTNNPKFFEKSYKIIQVVSNSISARDVKKGIQKKKYKDKQKSKLINEYQSLQIQLASISVADQHNINTLNQMGFSKSKLVDSSRSKKIIKEIKTLEEKIKKEMPSYFKLIQPSGASVKEIQKKLGINQAFIEFFFFEKEFYTVVIKKKDHKIFKSNKSLEELEGKAQLIKTTLGVNNSGKLDKFDTNSAYAIYNEIFAPIENFLGNASEIVIVPNKFLKNIPLHLLPMTRSKNCMECSKVDWLMNKYDFAYIPNAEFFAFQDSKKISLTKLLPKELKEKTKQLTKKIKKRSSDYIYLGIGDPNLGTNQQVNTQQIVKRIDKLTKILSRGAFINNTNEIRNIYGPVEGSREELNTIKKYLEPSKSLLLLSDDANEIKIKNMDLSKYALIHFATHGELAGFIKGQNEPFLVLTPPDSGTVDNDGLLTTSEIMNLDNNAEIVILSACNTASDDIKRSEGFSGLARAFLYSGSKSVLVSNWYVETFAAKEITTGFIKEIKNKPNISTANALSGSMKNFIQNNKDKSHPFYWAPFVIVGINSKINL